MRARPITEHCKHLELLLSAGTQAHQQQESGWIPDPFVQFSLCPFQFEDGDADSPSSGSLPSPASSLHSTQHHDEGLVSSRDPAASEFLLFCVALHDQGFAGQHHQAAAAAGSKGASKDPSSQLGSCTGSSNGLCALTRTCAGALDAMLPSDCDAHAASRDAQGQQRPVPRSRQQKKQQPEQEQQDASVHMH